MSLRAQWRTLKIEISHRTFIKNVLQLATGTLLSQIILVTSMPILTRLYTPENFGVYGVFIAVSAILGMLADGRYSLSIVLPDSKREGANLLLLCLVSAAMVLFILTVLLLCTGEAILKVFDRVTLTPYTFLIPLQAFFIAGYQSLYYWFNRERQYRLMALSKIILYGSIFLLSTIYGLYGDTQNGLIFSLCIGQFAAMICLMVKFIRDKSYQLFNATCMFQQAKRYCRFPKFLMLAHTLNTLSLQLPNILLNYFFGPIAAGYFLLAQRCINMPMNLVGQAIGDVFRENAAREYVANGNCLNMYRKTFWTLTKISLCFTILLILLAKPIIVLIFGGQWETTGTYIQYLSVYFMINFVSSPLSNMFVIAEKQSIDLLYNIIRTFCVGGSIIGVYSFGGTVEYTVIFCGISYALIYILDLI